MDIIEFYKGILTSVGLVFDVKGGTYLETVPGQLEPYHIGGKHLVLPTQDVLRQPNWDTQIAFHPLSENIARKNSVIFNELQRLSNIACNVDIGTLMFHMVELCANRDKQKTLNHRQTAFLQLFPDADETSVKNFDRIEGKNTGENSYVKLITTRDGKLDNQTYPRVTKVRFPFYEDCVEQSKAKQKEYHLFGIKIRKKDLFGYKALFEYIIKNCGNPDAFYSCGSRSQTAPSFHALMTSVHRVKADARKVFALLKLDVPEIHWGDQLDNLNQYKGHIPPLNGNEGELTEGEKRRQELTTAPPAPPAQAPSVLPAVVPPVTQPQPVPAVVQPMVAPQVVAPVVPAPVPPGTKPANGVKTIPFKSPFAQPQVPQYTQPVYAAQPQVIPPGMQPVQQVPAMPAAVAQQPNQYYRPVDQFGRPLNNMTGLMPMAAPQMGYMGYQQAMPGYGMPMMPGMQVGGWNR